MTERPVPGLLRGLVLVPAAWFAAGVAATFSGNAERVFPPAFLGLLAIGIGIVIAGTVRRPEMRRGLLIGSLGSLCAAALVWGAILLAQP